MLRPSQYLVALPPPERGRNTRDERADEQRERSAQGRRSSGLSRRIGGLPDSQLGRLQLPDDVIHAHLGSRLRDARARRNELRQIGAIFGRNSAVSDPSGENASRLRPRITRVRRRRLRLF